MNTKHIYDFIDRIEARPGMYVKEYSLDELRALLAGYLICLDVHGIIEEYEGRPFHPVDFMMWLSESRQWSGSKGFVYAINQHSDNAEEAFFLFMKLVSEFRHSS